jgi:hypothetical protein
MNRDSIQKLRLDRRLIRRSGWISQQELERELAALPDVSAKLITLGEAEDSAESAEGAEETASG